jgi:hypothetical protein
MLLSVACPAVQYFSVLSHKWQDFLKKRQRRRRHHHHHVAVMELQLL